VAVLLFVYGIANTVQESRSPRVPHPTLEEPKCGHPRQAGRGHLSGAGRRGRGGGHRNTAAVATVSASRLRPYADLDVAIATGDPRPCARWGGFNPCRRLGRRQPPQVGAEL